MCEMLWSDPQDEPGRQPNKRGVGVAFGASPPLLLSAPARSFCLAQPTRAPPACLAAILALNPGGRPPPQQQQISNPGAQRAGRPLYPNSEHSFFAHFTLLDLLTRAAWCARRPGCDPRFPREQRPQPAGAQPRGQGGRVRGRARGVLRDHLLGAQLLVSVRAWVLRDHLLGAQLLVSVRAWGVMACMHLRCVNASAWPFCDHLPCAHLLVGACALGRVMRACITHLLRCNLTTLVSAPRTFLFDVTHPHTRPRPCLPLSCAQRPDGEQGRLHHLHRGRHGARVHAVRRSAAPQRAAHEVRGRNDARHVWHVAA